MRATDRTCGLVRAHREPRSSDVGAGNNPHLRADVLCARFLADDLHRGGTVARDLPLVAGDATALPFKTGSVDLLIARARRRCAASLAACCTFG